MNPTASIILMGTVIPAVARCAERAGLKHHSKRENVDFLRTDGSHSATRLRDAIAQLKDTFPNDPRGRTDQSVRSQCPTALTPMGSEISLRQSAYTDAQFFSRTKFGTSGTFAPARADETKTSIGNRQSRG